MYYLLLCPSCNSVLSYKYENAKRPRKKCPYCSRKFDVSSKVIIKSYDNSTECLAAHKIVSKQLHLNVSGSHF